VAGRNKSDVRSKELWTHAHEFCRFAHVNVSIWIVLSIKRSF
jgi:hypothetical protein